MSIPSPEKDSLLGPTVYKKIAYQILKKGGFFWTTLYNGLDHIMRNETQMVQIGPGWSSELWR